MRTQNNNQSGEHQLFAIPFACSLAVHISLREAEIPFRLHWLQLDKRVLDDGRDFREINPKGKVSTLLTATGAVMTENPSILYWIAHTAAAQGRDLGLSDTRKPWHLIEWLSFLGSEIHRQVLGPFFDPKTPQACKDYPCTHIFPKLLSHLEDQIKEQQGLLGPSFTVADAYLYWILCLTPKLGVDLDHYPSLVDFHNRHSQRPTVAEALKLEWAQRQSTVTKKDTKP